MNDHLVAATSSPLHACNIENIHDNGSNLFLCGMYELSDEASQFRSGMIGLYRFDHQLGSTDREPGITLQQSFSTDGGVFDISICRHGDSDSSKRYIAASLSTGKIAIYTYNSTNGIDPTCLCDASPDDTSMYLSVGWDSNECPGTSSACRICSSSQDGSIMTFSFDQSGLHWDRILRDTHARFGESMPVWTTTFHPYDKSILLSGGDDSCMKLWDLRLDGTTSIASNSKAHEAGVTIALWHPHETDIFFTGSYDEHIRVWDYRNVSKPMNTIKTAGGVWRLKRRSGPKQSSYLASANMQGGCSIIKLDSSYNLVTSVNLRDKRIDDCLVYGVDFLEQPLVIDETTCECVLASSSFYDNNISIWQTRS
jgi:diphthine methyl ester acylhydrolase